MRTLRPSLAAIIILVLAMTSGSAVLAQSDDAPAAWVEATSIAHPCVGLGEPEEYIEETHVTRLRGSALDCSMDLGDARLKGTADMSWNYDCYDAVGAGCVRWGSVVLTGPDGTWEGTFSGVESPAGSGASFSAEYIELAGRGAYDGLAYVGQAANQFSTSGRWFGIVYEGELPSPSAE